MASRRHEFGRNKAVQAIEVKETDTGLMLEVTVLVPSQGKGSITTPDGSIPYLPLVIAIPLTEEELAAMVATLTHGKDN